MLTNTISSLSLWKVAQTSCKSALPSLRWVRNSGYWESMAVMIFSLKGGPDSGHVHLSHLFPKDCKHGNLPQDHANGPSQSWERSETVATKYQRLSSRGSWYRPCWLIQSVPWASQHGKLPKHHANQASLPSLRWVRNSGYWESEAISKGEQIQAMFTNAISLGSSASWWWTTCYLQGVADSGHVHQSHTFPEPLNMVNSLNIIQISPAFSEMSQKQWLLRIRGYQQGGTDSIHVWK